MSKDKIIEILNKAISKDTPPTIEEYLLIISEYLTEINYKDSEKVISLITQQPFIVTNFIPKVVDYFTRKLNICSIIENKQTILYYGD